jgi:hypothetical protein
MRGKRKASQQYESRQTFFHFMIFVRSSQFTFCECTMHCQ